MPRFLVITRDFVFLEHIMWYYEDPQRNPGKINEAIAKTTTVETLKICNEILSRLDFLKIHNSKSMFKGFAKQSRLKNKHWVKIKLKAFFHFFFKCILSFAFLIFRY